MKEKRACQSGKRAEQEVIRGRSGREKRQKERERAGRPKSAYVASEHVRGILENGTDLAMGRFAEIYKGLRASPAR